MVRALPAEQDEQPGPQVARGGLALGLLRIARPKQWIKNVLVLAAPAAAGMLGHSRPLLRGLATLGIFCLAASGSYFLNDTLDAEADRHHPVKRLRPVAAGVVGVAPALACAAVLMAVSLGLASWLAGLHLFAVMAIYLAVSTAYSLWLKHQAVFDLAGLSSGFILRAVAGGVATGLVLSNWFVIVVSFGSLLVAAGKRSAEHLSLGDVRSHHRPVLAEYPPTFLRFVRVLAASVTVAAYCLWAFERAAHNGVGHHPLWYELSIVPVVIAVLHLELRFDQGRGEAPEEMALHDHMLQGLALAWAFLFALGIYT